MTSRERVRKAIRHEPTDRVPIDLGATPVTGISASVYARLKQALGLGGPVRVPEPFQLLADVEETVRERLGVDVVGLCGPGTMFGYRNTGRWKPWTMEDGTEVLVSEEFETLREANGDTVIYPCGDRSCAPAGRMPKGGYYFDAIVRQGPVDEDKLDPREFAQEQYTVFSQEELAYLQERCEWLYRNTDCGIVGSWGGAGLGDIAQVPGTMLRDPKGVRDPQLWYEMLATHPEYAQGIFEYQTEVALKNLRLYEQAAGDMVDVLWVSGTDFGTRRGPLASAELFRSLWKPFYTKINAWVHENTPWKTMYHSCGGIRELLGDFVEMGVDIINPVQCSAAGMEAAALKRDFGDKLVFWGAGIDTQKVLPFGRADEVRRQVRDRIEVLGKGGGYVFNPIHNVQAGTPVENVLAMFEEAQRVDGGFEARQKMHEAEAVGQTEL